MVKLKGQVRSENGLLNADASGTPGHGLWARAPARINADRYMFLVMQLLAEIIVCFKSIIFLMVFFINYIINLYNVQFNYS